MTYREEFPNFGEVPEVAELLARGFVDTSWHNDSAPTFVSRDMTLRVWIEHAEPSLREFGENAPRFAIERGDFNPETHVDTLDAPDLAYEGDDWSALKAALDEEAAS